MKRSCDRSIVVFVRRLCLTLYSLLCVFRRDGVVAGPHEAPAIRGPHAGSGCVFSGQPGTEAAASPYLAAGSVVAHPPLLASDPRLSTELFPGVFCVHACVAVRSRFVMSLVGIWKRQKWIMELQRFCLCDKSGRAGNTVRSGVGLRVCFIIFGLLFRASSPRGHERIALKASRRAWVL